MTPAVRPSLRSAVSVNSLRSQLEERWGLELRGQSGTALSRTSSLRRAVGAAAAVCATAGAGALLGHRVVTFLLATWATARQNATDRFPETR